MNQQPDSAGPFEVVEGNEIEGVPHKLVYTQVRQPATDFDARALALQSAVQAEATTFRKSTDEEPDTKIDAVVKTAEKFYAFLKEGL